MLFCRRMLEDPALRVESGDVFWRSDPTEFIPVSKRWIKPSREQPQGLRALERIVSKTISPPPPLLSHRHPIFINNLPKPSSYLKRSIPWYVRNCGWVRGSWIGQLTMKMQAKPLLPEELQILRDAFDEYVSHGSP